MPFEHILDGETRGQSQKHVHVSQTEIGIKEHHPCTQGLQSIGKVDDNMRFSYPSLATGKGEDLHTGVDRGSVRTAPVRLTRPQSLELVLPGIIGQASQGECLIHGGGSSLFNSPSFLS